MIVCRIEIFGYVLMKVMLVCYELVCVLCVELSLSRVVLLLMDGMVGCVIVLLKWWVNVFCVVLLRWCWL